MDSQTTKEMKLIKTGMITQKLQVNPSFQTSPKERVHWESYQTLREVTLHLYKFSSKREMKPSPTQFSEASLTMIQNILRKL